MLSYFLARSQDESPIAIVAEHLVFITRRGRRFLALPAALFLVAMTSEPLSASEPPARELAERFAALALDCVHREYPNKIAHVMSGDEDAKPPRMLTPAFFGCYDWHSAVHGHWLLARFARLFPEHELAAEARAVLSSHLTPENVAAEAVYLAADPDREGYQQQDAYPLIAAEDVETETDILFQREMLAPGYLARFVPARIGDTGPPFAFTHHELHAPQVEGVGLPLIDLEPSPLQHGDQIVAHAR